MEAHLTSGGEDVLIDGLRFQPPSNTANYCVANRQVRYFAESGNRFDPVSSRVIRFRLADTGFLESASCRLGLTITNHHTANLTPIASAFNPANAASTGAEESAPKDTLFPDLSSHHRQLHPRDLHLQLE